MIYFAIKVENATITVYDGVRYEGTGWVHVHLINKGNDIWDAVIVSEDGMINLTKTGIDGTVNPGNAYNYPASALSTVLYKGASDVNFFFYNYADSTNGVAYTTEVRGVEAR